MIKNMAERSSSTLKLRSRMAERGGVKQAQSHNLPTINMLYRNLFIAKALGVPPAIL